MNFDFEPQQYEFRDAFKSFLDNDYPLERHRRLLDGTGFDPTLWSAMAELGLFGVLVPEHYGGLGLSFVDLALILEELGKALVPPPVGETLVATDILMRYGTADQQQLLLPKVASGALRLTLAVSETDRGYDPDDIATTAVSTGSGWVLSGRKILVPHAAVADLVLVTARIGAGRETAIVLLEPGRPGVSISSHETLDPTSRFHAVHFENVRLTPTDVLGGRASHAAVARLFDVGATAAALQMIGVAGRVLDIAVAYATTRVQFGKPIGSFQAIKHRCADMAVKTDAGRTAAYYASWAVAEDAAERLRAASIAKSFCGDASRFVCNEGIQVHGGMGFTWELGLHFYLRRAKVLEYSWGDAAMHRERVIAAALAELPTGG